jgi:hypothetical protein
MEIGIVTIVYNGYGKFLDNWLASIDRLHHRPKDIVIVLGKDSGIFKDHGDYSFAIPRGMELKIVEVDSDNMGKLKNIGVTETNTEWVMVLDIDDEILPWAIKEFEYTSNDADMIVAPYINLAEKSFLVYPKITADTLLSEAYYRQGNNFMHGGIPFKRKLWEKYHFQENDCSNSLFWIDCATQNPRIRTAGIPCLTYNRREDSHSHVDSTERMKRFEIINNYRKSKI